MISRNHAHFSTLSVSRMQVDSRIHAEMKSFSRIRSITQSRNPMGGPLQSQSVEKKYQGDGSKNIKSPHHTSMYETEEYEELPFY